MGGMCTFQYPVEELTMVTIRATEQLAKQKLEAFERLQSEFEASFHFVQEVHGQRRFATFPVIESVHYLHALWICECKDRLLSVYKNIERYEGRYCLELLQRWQSGETADVMEFLYRKLDGFPFAELTRQIQEAKSASSVDAKLVDRLVHGRLTLFNRFMNLMHGLDAILAMSEDDLRKQVLSACARFGHTPSQIEHQLAEMEKPLYSYMRHQLLARRNMLVMNKSGVNVMTLPTDRPGERSWKVAQPVEPLTSFAEHPIEGYLELISPTHNNLRRDRFVDRPEIDRDGFRV
jgi:hypothetical protein